MTTTSRLTHTFNINPDTIHLLNTITFKSHYPPSQWQHHIPRELIPLWHLLHPHARITAYLLASQATLPFLPTPDPKPAPPSE
jgi:hypothetical protein